MTEIPDEQVAQLIASVDRLDKSVRSNAVELATFKEDQRAKDDRAAKRTSNVRRLGWVGSAIALVALVGAALGINGEIYQNCRNHHSDSFFAAERLKVCGQVKGVAQIVPQTKQQQARIKARCGGVVPTTPDPRTGVAQFEGASLDYLDRIHSAGGAC